MLPASRGEAALGLLDRAHDEIDRVFTDVIMQGISGLDLARGVRSRRPALPVTLMIGYSHAVVADKDHGFALLREPYSLEEFAASSPDAGARPKGLTARSR
ncbi:hypothetical protein K7957_05975 [Sphingomonas yunnanensis]|uniref:hypothetical protein n=1 Tax=Sphingomonas yunnanensis TaxID=310400 RepID=UPI001CA76DF7|nr:hypothetical protein [Sphingomonas yunnanensis]MBY9062476.1 hypothetical protein [Sphingomonas yunnanensis]